MILYLNVEFTFTFWFYIAM